MTRIDMILGLVTAVSLGLYLLHVLCRPERY